MFRVVSRIGISEDRTYIEREVDRQATCIGPAIDEIVLLHEPPKFPALVVGVIAVRHYPVARVTNLLSPGDWPLGSVERRMLTRVKDQLIDRPALDELACQLALLLCAHRGCRPGLQKPSNVCGMFPPCTPLLPHPLPRLSGAVKHIAGQFDFWYEVLTNIRKWVLFTRCLIETRFEQIWERIPHGPHGS